MTSVELKEILRELLAEVQHLRVDLAMLQASQSPSASVADLLEARNQEQTKVVKDTAKLVEKIEALS